MLDFKWKNGQAPSLNASNMQLITDAINSNEAKIKDVESEVAEIVIEHGGSIVIPNPEEEATDTLSKVKINQEVFEIEGGGDSGEDISYEDYMALVAADEDEENKNYFVPDAPIGIPVAEEFEKVYEEINYIKHDVQEIEDKKAENTTLTDVFDATKSYSVGDYFISNNQLFKVKVACSGITPPNSTYYDSISVMNELKASLNNKVNITRHTATVGVSGTAVVDLGAQASNVFIVPLGAFLNADATYVASVMCQDNRYLRIRASYSGSASNTHTYSYLKIEVN